MKNYLLIILISLGIASCVTQKEFNEVLEKDAIVYLEAFINEHPKSKFVPQAKKAIDSLIEDADWSIAELQDTIPSYQKYLESHDKGLYSETAKNRISYLKEYYAIANCDDNPTIDCFEQFLKDYPSSRYQKHAKYSIDYLTEENFLNDCKELNTIEGFEALMKKFPEPLVFTTDSVLSYINKLQMAKDIYTEVVNEDDTYIYQSFIELYSFSNYADSAQSILNNKEQEDWNKIKNSKNLNKLRDFLDKYPNGTHYSEINDRYVELKIKKIYEGRHLPMPEFIDKEQTSDLLSYPEIDTYNKTDLVITITYNGPSKVFVEIPPRTRKKIVLKPGKYEVSAEAKNIIPFYGKETFEPGSTQSIDWYIRTSRY